MYRTSPLVVLALVGCPEPSSEGPEQTEGNQAPSVLILSPSEGEVAALTGPDSLMRFVGGATDLEDADACCALEWSSDLDGFLGSGSDLTWALQTLGEHTITLTATDREGLTGSASVGVEVVFGPPTVTVLSPITDATPVVGEWVLLEAEASDLSAPGGLPDDAFVWESSPSGSPFPAVGATYGVRLTTVGPRTLSVTVTNAYEASETVQVDVDVQPPAPEAPTVAVELPAPGAVLEWDTSHLLRAQITSNYSGGGIVISADGWTLDHGGISYDVIEGVTGTTVNPGALLPTDLCGDVDADIVRWASDTGGKTFAVVPVTIRYPGCP
ncbi:MAG: hypothetical protein KTR31_40175 [Myxococcales bacterium]|nr:hypothetical protein [Myxococcales bacterium]